MTTFDKLVDGATKIKLAPPKPKYIEPILLATTEGERSDDFRTVMRALGRRLQDSAWTIVYKSLLVIHIMIREGDENVCIKYLSSHLSVLDIHIGKSGKFISNGGELNQVYSYAHYLATRAKEFANTGHDFIRETKKPYGSWNSSDKSSILREMPVEKGLLRETESVQRQIDALVRCKFRESEINNDLLVLSFRMLTTDLISLYQCLNEGVLNLLEHFFDLSKSDAERAFEIYEHFTKETKKAIEFLRVAKHLESVTKLRVPTIKHAQTSLTSSLREYLDDPDFEINRRQYLAEKEFSKQGGTQQQALQQQALQQQAHAQAQAQQLQFQMLQAQATANAGVQQQATGFNPFSNMNTFSMQPAQATVPQPQPLTIQTSQSYIQNPMAQMNLAATVPMNLQTPVQQTPNAFSTDSSLVQPRVLSNNFTGNGFGASTSTTTPLTTQADQELQRRLQNEAHTGGSNAVRAVATGTNPFRLETHSTASPSHSSNGGLATVSELKMQPTAGGLERLPTVPVFPETQRDAYQQQLQRQAGIELSQQVLQKQMTSNPFSQQATGMIQQASLNPNSYTGNNGNDFNFVGMSASNVPNAYLIQQQQLQQQMLQQQQQQQQQQQPVYSSIYNGPNLLG
ncbi:hypothetical protein PICMEDRAFT_36159 [Pichia membranifaciens NRRL Y-2026]|uniref:ENTH domain-containing protein n=1 Tax=Pichia membranifaciens NRRL Y-2026 TaxID=763406 RepID=A0A1E3NFT3_9ASCO|nr:hypothetical protein PICMEDRAFT_36159 [Pichia membranifaciens NRRL Y-2026]ODQ44984.1 hypothetical protein PICMEDRAFT_36159 [Pichia membranifaciens NRRL Y-2026]